MKCAQNVLEAAKILLDANASKIEDPMSLAILAFNDLCYRDLTVSEGWLLKCVIELATAITAEKQSVHGYIEATASLSKLAAKTGHTYPGISREHLCRKTCTSS